MLGKELHNALDIQIGGSHYKDCNIQPIEYITANQLNFLAGCVVKRITRYNKPTGKGMQDIDKAIHELQLIKQLEYSEQQYWKRFITYCTTPCWQFKP